MMPTYDPATRTVVAMMEDVRNKYHGHLVRAEVTTGLVFARGRKNKDGEVTSYAIVRNGLRLAGLAKIIDPLYRERGVADTLILLDGDRWGDWTERKQLSLLDHELTHFALKYEKNAPTVWQTDDLGRPVVAIKPHDYEVGWFHDVARRWGVDSFEVEQASQLCTPNGQLIFPWAANPRGESEEASVTTNTFAALLSVGNTEGQARRMIDKVSAGGAAFETVADMVDACYRAQMEEAPADTIKMSGKAAPKGNAKGKGKSKAQLEQEAEEAFNAKP